MYYHAIVETKNKNKQGNYESHYELGCNNLEEIIELIIKPYTKKEEIYIDGMYINFNDIRSLKIKKLIKPLKSYAILHKAG